LEKYPVETSATDLVVGSTKAIISMIPIAGSPLIEILNMIVTPSLQKRRDEWFSKLGEKLIELEDKDCLTLEDLQHNEIFIDISIKATELALKTSQAEKLEALRNALLNSAKADSIDISIQQIFLSYIDTFTVWHIKLLKLFDNPKEYESKLQDLSMGGLNNLIYAAYPELTSKDEFVRQVFKDLYSKGLLNTESLGATMTLQGILSRRTTTMGQDFIKYISEVEI